MPIYHQHNLLSCLFPKGVSSRHSLTVLNPCELMVLVYLFPTDPRQWNFIILPLSEPQSPGQDLFQ